MPALSRADRHARDGQYDQQSARQHAAMDAIEPAPFSTHGATISQAPNKYIDRPQRTGDFDNARLLYHADTIRAADLRRESLAGCTKDGKPLPLTVVQYRNRR
jgi:hypothetical protein